FAGRLSGTKWQIGAGANTLRPARDRDGQTQPNRGGSVANGKETRTSLQRRRRKSFRGHHPHLNSANANQSVSQSGKIEFFPMLDLPLYLKFADANRFVSVSTRNTSPTPTPNGHSDR